MNWVVAILWTMLRTVAERFGPSSPSTEEVLEVNASRLREQFDQWLKEPDAYRQRALRECSAFPEGRIYPFAIPALGYANMGLGDAKQREHSAAQMQKLIELLTSTVIEDIRPPGGDLNRLLHYQKEGTRLATLNLTLACYALIWDEGRYGSLHDRVSLLLRRALTEGAGKPLASYPAYTWYFDTIMALVSLELYDRAHGLAQTGPLIEQHFAWLRSHASDTGTGLPVAYEGGLPRGCDLSMQICLLQQLDSRTAQRVYADYVRHHWVNFGFIAGFREWPKSKGRSSRGDIDSGPLILGIGPTGTGVGIGAAKAVGDANRLSTLARQLKVLPHFLRLLEWGGEQLFGDQVGVSSQYVTGFLYGDAVLFYAITWVPYPGAAKETAKSAPNALSPLESPEVRDQAQPGGPDPGRSARGA
jgi:hypothetical protein